MRTGGKKHRSRQQHRNAFRSFAILSLHPLSLSPSLANSGSISSGAGFGARGFWKNLTKKGTKIYKYGKECPGGGSVARPHAVCSVDGSTYTYDGNGNMIGGNSRTVAYNAANKPIRIERAPAVPTGNDTGYAEFIYGADRNRVVQVSAAAAGGGIARTVYVGMGATGKSLYEKTSKGSAVEHVQFLYAGGAHAGGAFALRTTSGTSTTAGMRYHHFDHLGSVTAMSDERGRILATSGGNADMLSFDVWGARRNPDGTSANPAVFELKPGHREYTGHEAIPNVGLVNMNGRVYDPVLGRFLSPDPNVQFIANLQSFNRYSYAQNNPLKYTDPTGYFLDSRFDFIVNASLVATGILVAPVCPQCSVPLLAAGIYYNTASMANSGASFDQIVAVNAISMFAGLYGGSIGAYYGGRPGAILGGAISGAMSGGLTTAAFGGSLGENMMLGAAQSALMAAAIWSLQKEVPVSKAAEARQQGGGRGAGRPGSLTEGDLERIVNGDVPNAKDIDPPFDPRTERRLGELDLRLQPVARRHLELLRQEGVDARVLASYRTYDQQDALYAQGRTEPGPIVTNARGGQSYHNFRVAYDIGIFDSNGAYVSNGSASGYQTAGRIGTGLGLEWGGNFQSIHDPPHFQFSAGVGVSTMDVRYRSGLDVFTGL